MQTEDDISNLRLDAKDQLYRLIWNFSWGIFARPIPRTYLNAWKIALLRLFGAKIEKNAIVYSSAKIYNPKKLIMNEGAVLGPEVDCYNVDYITIGRKAIISQKTFLCTASHDITSKEFSLITSQITIEENAWVAADAFVGMGITIGKNAVVGARSSVFKNVAPNVVVGGNPAKFIKNRY